MKTTSTAINPKTTLEGQTTMPHAECRGAALDAAIKAHIFHFGRDHTFVIIQDGVEVTKRKSSNQGPSLKYTVEFEVPGIRQSEMEAHLISIGLAKQPTPPKTPPPTSITFEYWLEEDFPIKDKLAPEECTDRNCPLGYFFHYKGLFIDDGGCLDAAEYFGNTCPPARIWDADKRVKLRLNPTDMDRKLVKTFAEFHYWHFGQGYEGSESAVIENSPKGWA